jgi:hypothetical protein
MRQAGKLNWQAVIYGLRATSENEKIILTDLVSPMQ